MFLRKSSFSPLLAIRVTKQPIKLIRKYIPQSRKTNVDICLGYSLMYIIIILCATNVAAIISDGFRSIIGVYIADSIRHALPQVLSLVLKPENSG